MNHHWYGIVFFDDGDYIVLFKSTDDYPIECTRWLIPGSAIE